MTRLSIAYSLLFTLSLIAINPWGVERGEIWTAPKVFAIQLIITCNSWVLLHQRQQRGSLALPREWKIAFGLWLLFLGSGLIATLGSPFPGRSLWGQSTLGDGWVYWLLLATFVLSNALVLRQDQTLARSQLYGLLIGGAIVALSIFPQVLDWRIDYTVTSGQVSQTNPTMLASTIWQNHMPIGLYSNRGHTVFVLAGVSLLAFLGGRWGWVKPQVAIAVSLLAIAGLICTQVRGGIVALLVAAIYLLWRCLHPSIRRQWFQRYRTLWFWGGVLSSVAAVFAIDNLEHFSSGRLHLWQLALTGIAQRWLWGWGFNGFGIAFPWIADWDGQHRGYLLEKVAVAQVLRLNDFTFDYQGIDGQFYTGILISNKAHNLVLDTALSVGIVGLVCCGLLWFFFMKKALRTPLVGLEVVAIAYLVYAFTWYESAQFSHLAWWVLSVGLGVPKTAMIVDSNRTAQPRNQRLDKLHLNCDDSAKN